MTDSGIIASVGTTGYSYDKALTEMVNGLYKTEVIHYLKQNGDDAGEVERTILEWMVLRAQLSSCKVKSIINRFSGSIRLVYIVRLVMCHLLSLKSAMMII